MLPIVITTYFNIIFRMGINHFIDKLKQNNIQGLIVPDLPFEEARELKGACRKGGMHLISLIAPTTNNQRLKKIVKDATGFIYLVGVKGVTGTSKQADSDMGKMVRKIKNISNIPILLGFGIATPEQVKKIKALGVDGFIVGSQICRLYCRNSLNKVHAFAKEMKKACSRAKPS